MNTIEIELSELEFKLIKYSTSNPEQWVKNLVLQRCQSAKEEIDSAEIKRLRLAEEQIPLTSDETVSNYFDRLEQEASQQPLVEEEDPVSDGVAETEESNNVDTE